EDDLAPGARIGGPHHDDLALFAAHDDAIAEPRRQPIALLDLNQTRRVDDAGVEQAGQQVDEPRAADAERRRLTDGVDVDVVVHGGAIDGAEGAAHPVTDLRALERRPGRRRAGEKARARPEHHLTVRPDVDGAAGALPPLP